VQDRQRVRSEVVRGTRSHISHRLRYEADDSHLANPSLKPTSTSDPHLARGGGGDGRGDVADTVRNLDSLRRALSVPSGLLQFTPPYSRKADAMDSDSRLNMVFF
jgi:hypothetical protein